MTENKLNQEISRTLKSLRRAIELDRNLFDKVNTDGGFDSVRPYVDRLLDDILNEKKTIAKEEIENAQEVIRDAKSQNAEKYASDEFERARVKLKDSIDLFNSLMKN